MSRLFLSRDVEKQRPRPVLTEIYLCHVCSCQEMLRSNGRGQFESWWERQDPSLHALIRWKFFEPAQILAAISTPLAPFNWMLAAPAASASASAADEPSLAVVKAGSRSLHELGEWLEPGRALYAYSPAAS
eukprot:COSAG01_NODE_286_length_19421_cov_123.895663_2_plen_131_part_00